MSTLGVRRMKERGGGGGKVTAGLPNLKPVTPFSDKTCVLTGTITSINRSSRSERPRSVSRGAAIVPRIGPDVDARRRNSSSSSVPRGRSSSPFEGTRIRVSSVKAPGFPNRSSDLEMSSVRARNVKGMSGFRVLEKKGLKEHALKENINTGAKLGKEFVQKASLDDVGLSIRRSSEKALQKSRPKLSSRVSGKVVNVVGVGGRVVDKYPSKLHEKLAFLEGKVKRIASDIKRTKEMLDTNNTDASKVIISDIQDKISGIEKAMSHVVGESDGNAVKTVSYPVNENPLSFECLDEKENQPKFSMDLCNDLDVSEIEETEDGVGTPTQQGSNSSVVVERNSADVQLTSDEHFEEFDEQENTPVMIVEGDTDENSTSQIRELGRKVSTGGWFVSEGESVLLVHDDGSCSLHDVANTEVKSEYKPPSSIFSNIWSDCWVIRAPCADGCSGKYVVAASAGNTLESGFCSWDFYTKEVQAFHIEEGTSNKRSILAPLQGRSVQRRNTLSTMMSTENRQWWYKPSGSLIVATASFQKSVQIFDIRDCEGIMKWNVSKPVLNMDHSSPLQWRNREKVVIAETDGITLWDVGSLKPQVLLSANASGHKITALHVNNTDAEGGGVRQRSSSSEAEGHDGVFCTTDSINILDFREPSGIGLKISTLGINAQSVFSRGDSVYLGCSILKPNGKTNCSSQVQHFSIRRQKLVSSYVLPESNAHSHHTSLSQVWGNSDLVMGVSGQGLFVFDALKDEILPSFALDYCGPQKAREVIGSDDLYTPTFDYSSSQALLISRDRPALFKYL